MNQLVLKKKNELMKKKKGFTLVELIIVIAIIAVLAVVAIPKFGAVKKDANISADKANAKIIATAVASAVTDGKTFTAETLAEGDIAKITPYIDGGSLPVVKQGGSWTIKYSTDSGTVVEAGGNQMYPVTD